MEFIVTREGNSVTIERIVYPRYNATAVINNKIITITNFKPIDSCNYEDMQKAINDLYDYLDTTLISVRDNIKPTE